MRQHVDTDKIQLGFMPGCKTANAIFILRQLHEKYLAKKENLYTAFVDLEKSFNRVSRDVVWWTLRKLSVEEGLAKIVQSMYRNARSWVRVTETFSDHFLVQVGLH